MRAQTTLLLVQFQPTLGWRIILWSVEGWFDSPFKNLSSEQEQEFEQSCVRKPSGARTWLGLVRPRHRATLSTFSTTQDLWSPLSQRTWWRERQRMWKWSVSRSGIRSGSSSISPSSCDLHLLDDCSTLCKVFLTTSFTYVVSHLILIIQDLPVDTDPEERFICAE